MSSYARGSAVRWVTSNTSCFGTEAGCRQIGNTSDLDTRLGVHKSVPPIPRQLGVHNVTHFARIHAAAKRQVSSSLSQTMGDSEAQEGSSCGETALGKRCGAMGDIVNGDEDGTASRSIQQQPPTPSWETALGSDS